MTCMFKAQPAREIPRKLLPRFAMPNIDPTVSVGNLMSIATVIVAVVLAYARTEARISLVETKALQTAAELGTLRQERATNVLATEGRIRALEVNEGRFGQRLTGIESLLTRIDNRLERMEAEP